MGSRNRFHAEQANVWSEISRAYREQIRIASEHQNTLDEDAAFSLSDIDQLDEDDVRFDEYSTSGNVVDSDASLSDHSSEHIVETEFSDGYEDDFDDFGESGYEAEKLLDEMEENGRWFELPEDMD